MIKKKKKPAQFSAFSFHKRDKWRKTLTASLRTSPFIGKMCSIRTKGKREERVSLSSSMSKSRLFTPLLFTLWAVPLSKFGSVRQNEKLPNPNFQEKDFRYSLVYFQYHFSYLGTSALKGVINNVYILGSLLKRDVLEQYNILLWLFCAKE